MTRTPASVRLLEVDPDFGRFLSDDDRAGARQLVVPVMDLSKGAFDAAALLRVEGGFGALVLEGMLMHRLSVGDQVTMRLLGPGDFVFLSGVPRSMLLGESTCSATGPTRVAILGNEVLAAVRRWPPLAAGIYIRAAEQADRLAVQLAISQLPRVDQRVLALLWLLAESWGHVGPSGTALPLSLTHEALGALIGARRPTVTLALGDLTERGALIRQGDGWLLLEQSPAASAANAAEVDEPSLLPPGDPAWRAGLAAQRGGLTRDELLRTLDSMRHEHSRARDRTDLQLARMRSSRARCTEIRRRIAADRLARLAPSSR